MADSKGLIIFFDGPDGVGKTTQLQRVASELQRHGHTVHATRALGGTPIGELLRQAALSDNARPAETDLYIALACQYALAKDILPRRDRGEIVLVDRSPISIIAYQVYGDGLDREAGYEAVGGLLDLIQPDLTLVYHADAETLQKRRGRRDHQAKSDYFEAKSLAYHQRVAEGFTEAGKFGAVLVEASGSVDAVHQATRQHLEPKVH